MRLRGDKYPPEQFIPIAEANGQIVELDRMVRTQRWSQQLANLEEAQAAYSPGFDQLLLWAAMR